MDPLQRLTAIEDIKQVEAARNRTLDTKDWAGYRAIHVEEIVSHSAPGQPLNGVDAMIAWLANELKDALSIHHCHGPEFSFDGPDKARVIWAYEAMTVFRRPGGDIKRHGLGFYHVDYVRRDGRWLIADRRQERLRVDEGGATLAV